MNDYVISWEPSVVVSQDLNGIFTSTGGVFFVVFSVSPLTLSLEFTN